MSDSLRPTARPGSASPRPHSHALCSLPFGHISDVYGPCTGAPREKEYARHEDAPGAAPRPVGCSTAQHPSLQRKYARGLQHNRVSAPPFACIVCWVVLARRRLRCTACARASHRHEQSRCWSREPERAPPAPRAGSKRWFRYAPRPRRCERESGAQPWRRGALS